MTQLLVSVRSAAEAAVALAGGADVIDIKEPRRGALGPADPQVWREVRAVVGRRAALSVALGELLADPAEDLAREAAGFAFAKVALAGAHHERGWVHAWRRVVRALPAGVALVPVAYADWQAAAAPAPSVGVALAEHTAARLLLIDTFDKSAGTLLDLMPLEPLTEIAAYAAERRVQLALAGSLDDRTIRRLVALDPAYLGVRGAACRGGRDGTIDLARVKSLAAIVRAGIQKAAS